MAYGVAGFVAKGKFNSDEELPFARPLRWLRRRFGLPVSQHRGSEPRGALSVAGAIALFCLATVGAVQFLRPSDAMPTAPFARLAEAAMPPVVPAATPTADAFGIKLFIPGRIK